jgi:hypothetical protein
MSEVNMISQLDIEKIFGKDRAQEDTNLSKYFIKTGQYETIKGGYKELVLGRKGSGKSALYSILKDELAREGKKVIDVSPTGEDIIKVHQKLSEYLKIGLDEDFKYSIAWKDFFLTEISLSIIKDIKKLGKEINPLYKYLVQDGTIHKTFVDKFVNSMLKAFGNQSIKVDQLEFKIDFTGLFENDSVKIDEVTKYIKDYLMNNQFYILIDNLDEPWKNNKEMNSWLRGLIFSSRQLKREFNHLNVIIFLRDDIFREIAKGSDLFDSKSEIIQINWYEEDNYNLRKMVAARIATFYNRQIPNDVRSINELWAKFYPPQIGYSTNHGTRWVYTSKYIIDRTFYRPRELLQFCKLILEKSRDGNIPVDADLIRISELSFCDWKVQDLVGEFVKTYSNIDTFIFTLAGVTRDWNIKYDKLLNHFNSLDESSKIYEKTQNKYLNLEETMKFLFQIGFLRRQKFTDSGRPYYVTSIEEQNINAKTNSFDIHPAFRKKLISRR